MAGTGTATIDFGSTPVEEATVLVNSGVSGLTAASYIEAFFMKESTSDNSVDEHAEAAALCPLVCEYVSATSFNIIASPIAALGIGQFSARWVYTP